MRNSTTASVYTLERTANGWQLRSAPPSAMIGRNGFAPSGEKREGDGRVPTGLFPLESAFGYGPSIDSRMPYRQATTDDLWVDDVDAPDYNTWVRRGETTARSSFDVMRIDDIRYSYGLWAITATRSSKAMAAVSLSMSGSMTVIQPQAVLPLMKKNWSGSWLGLIRHNNRRS